MHTRILFKPGTRPQPAIGTLAVGTRAWFTEIVFVKTCMCVPIYLSMFVRTHPREQILLVVKTVSL